MGTAGVLAGRTVLVSGAGEGLGRAVAEVALREDAKVMVAGRDQARLARMVAELDPSGERADHHRADIGSADDCRALVAATTARFGRLDGIVHNAALMGAGGLHGADIEAWREIFDVNVFGTLRLTQAALPHLEAARGSMVIIGTQAVFTCTMLTLGYSASKGALYTAAKHLATELAPTGVRVNTVVPSWMWGPQVQGWVRDTRSGSDEEAAQLVERIVATIPLGRITDPHDVAEVVAFLLSERARAITGQVVVVNGGEMMR